MACDVDPTLQTSRPGGHLRGGPVSTERHREGALAWDLVDYVRDRLTDSERHTVFVNLGVGDYLPVFDSVLGAVARENISLSPELVTQLQAWLEDYDRHHEFQSVFERAVGGGAA